MANARTKNNDTSANLDFVLATGSMSSNQAGDGEIRLGRVLKPSEFVNA